MTLYEQIKSAALLAAFTDAEGNVLWKTEVSPASTSYTDYFADKLKDIHPAVVYANQAGLAMALLCTRLNVPRCVAYQMSEVGLEEFRKNNIEVEYEELIPLVKSSKDASKVCPVEQYLADHPDNDDRWAFLQNKYTGVIGRSCSI